MAETQDSQGRRRRHEWTLLIVALFCIGVTVSLSFHEQYLQITATERERLQGQARVLGQNIGHHIVGADRALLAIASWHGSDREHWDPARLKALGEVIGGVRTLAILDTAGRAVNSSRPELIGTDFSQRDYFRSAAQQRDPKILHVAAPVMNATGVFAINVSRAVRGPDGAFAGVVVATLDPEFFQVLLESVRYAPDLRSGIAHGDGTLFLSVPEIPGTQGMDLSRPGTFFARHRDGGQQMSILDGTSASSRDDRLAALLTFMPVGVAADKPLVVMVSRDRAAIHASWWREVWIEGGLYALFALSAVIALVWHQRRQRQLDTEAATRERERRDVAERLVLATEASGVGVWEYDLRSQRLLWDATMLQIYGLPAGAMAATGHDAWLDALLPEDRDQAEAAFFDAVRTGTRFRLEFRIRRGDGAVRKICSFGLVRHDADGAAVSVTGINEDITERWRADEALRESEARFRLMADSAPVLIWVSSPSLARTYFNRPWLAFTGRPLAEMVGGGWAESVHPDDRERVAAEQGAAQRERRAFVIEYRLRRDGGAYCWVLEQGAPRFDSAGEFLGFVGSGIDIEARRRAEVELRTLSRAVEQSAAAVIITDRSGTIVYANPAASHIYGYANEELMGHNPRILKSGLTPEQSYHALWQTVLAGETWRGEITNRRRDGSLVEEAVTISPVRDDSGDIAQFVAIKEDIGAKRDAERMRHELDTRMVKLERMELLGSLAGGIAHDFNNILVAILGFSSIGQTVVKASGGSPRVIGFFEEIEIAGERAKLLVQQLRAFSRGGRMTVQPVLVAEVVHEVMSLLRVTFPAAVELSAEVSEQLPALNIDPSHLHQLLVNLCVNARDAMTGPGHVVVSARLVEVSEALVCDSCHREFAGEFFRIAVRDDGPGISQELRERVFEPFFTTKDVGRGTGMGLAVVHGVAHVYEGHMQLLTEVGKGTELAIYLPRSAPRLLETCPEASVAGALELSEHASEAEASSS